MSKGGSYSHSKTTVTQDVFTVFFFNPNPIPEFLRKQNTVHP